MESICQTNDLNGDDTHSVENPYGFIYITTNLINGKRYIGQKRFDNASRWKSYLGSGLHLLNAIKKYGKSNFKRDIVDIAFSFEELNKKEAEWIEVYDAVDSDDFYNQINGGSVQESLRAKNSVPVICLNNGKVFDSIRDASLWSGHVALTIKKTFKKDYDVNKSKLIFRPLTQCVVCSDLFLKTKTMHKDRTWCPHCQEFKRCDMCGVNEFKRTRGKRYCEECAKERERFRKYIYCKTK